MKIAIISDTHDNLANLEKTISFLNKEKINILLHCGDVTSIETLEKILKIFSGKFYLVMGNGDNYHSLEDNISSLQKEYLSILEWEKKIKEVKISHLNIAFTHFPPWAKNLAQSQKYDIVFYGHTHCPNQQKIGKTQLVNPGNLAGLFFKATFAIYDTKINKLELKILEKL